ncbi:MAG: DNA polymerase III subunit epsilon [Rhizobiaceae bacterium]
MTEPAYYFVTDIELDGPSIFENSMLSFATVVVRDDGEICGEFEGVLETIPGHTQETGTMEWWKTQPEAWEAARLNPEEPKLVMGRFADWVETFDGVRSFASKPLLLDGPWVDCYLNKYASTRIFGGPFPGRQIFHTLGLDIPSYVHGVLNHSKPMSQHMPIPQDWLGEHVHTHRAIDDARGYANLLVKMMATAGSEPILDISPFKGEHR